MNQTKSCSRVEALNRSAGAPANIADAERPELRRSLVLLWLAVAWIVGTLVFEVAAIGAENEPAAEKLDFKFAAALDADETGVSLASTPLDGLFRIENNERLKDRINGIIETETKWLAQQEAMKVIQLVRNGPASDPNISVEDDVEHRRQVAKAQFEISGTTLAEALGIQQVNHADELFAPIYVESSALPVRSETVPIKRDVVDAAEGFATTMRTDDEAINKSVLEAPKLSTSVVADKTETEPKPAKKRNSPTLLTVKPASKSTKTPNPERADAKVVRANPISLAKPAIDVEKPFEPVVQPVVKKDTEQNSQLPSVAVDQPAPPTNENSPSVAVSEALAMEEPGTVVAAVTIAPLPKTVAPTDDDSQQVATVAPLSGAVAPTEDNSQQVVIDVPSSDAVAASPDVSVSSNDDLQPVVSVAPLPDAVVPANDDSRQHVVADSTHMITSPSQDDSFLDTNKCNLEPEITAETKPEPGGELAPVTEKEPVAEAGPPLIEPQLAPVTTAVPPEERVAAAWPFTKAVVTEQNQPNVSLNVDSADVRTVFEMLARGYGMNILVSPDVTGVVTANVEGLTPEQTLHGVLKMCSLRAQVEEGVVYVYPIDKLPADARQLRLFPLDFARAESVEATVQGLLSPIGNAYTSLADSKDNLKTCEAVVVIDTPESIRRIESYIFQIDQPPRQVMIEARVLEVELNDTLEHGVDFSALRNREITIGTTGLTSAAAAGEAVFYAGIDGDDVGSLIELLETTTDAKTLASPKIMVVNGQEAKLQVGQQLGFTVATVTQTSTIQDVQFLDTGVVLSVTPTISRDNKVMMQVKPEVSNGQINPETLLPEEETRELETSVLLNDHQGMIIGGLIQETDRTVIKKLPWLGDVKHVGKFFQRRKAERSRSEIIVALIPHILEVDSCPHRDCEDHEKLEIEYQRTNTPILQGALQRACRPWEPRLPDTVGAERHYDVNEINRRIP